MRSSSGRGQEGDENDKGTLVRPGSWGCLGWGKNGGSSRGNVVTYGGHGPANEYITNSGSQVSDCQNYNYGKGGNRKDSCLEELQILI